MSLFLYQQTYSAFSHQVEETLDLVNQNEFDRPTLQSHLANLQQYFQTQILPLDMQTLPDETGLRVHGLQVEMNKQLRLIGTDALFLRAAKQPETMQQRLRQIGDRLQLLKRYCDGVLELGSP